MSLTVISYPSVEIGRYTPDGPDVVRQEMDLIADDHIHGFDTVIHADGSVRTQTTTAPTY